MFTLGHARRLRSKGLRPAPGRSDIAAHLTRELNAIRSLAPSVLNSFVPYHNSFCAWREAQATVRNRGKQRR